ncbi:tryptophan halogenase [Catenovulum agarivorans DS-2]|uniref:Tryptophan halogenase n=1 Tax=Catenovulum agarivorans DS-2 TaxID=1328313 RepID=W7QQQ0_9ALTE|nr:tryptophan halogenase family protein [Catenovulum agarivorans]EWH10208.1 tryptophan halogenase [Catenovulum agarivorans DS-2]
MKPIKNIVILGGGTAGWLTAAVIAAHHKLNTHSNIQLTLVESSDIPTVGVGEGTWPTMKNTLQAIGINEHEFLKTCQATFKQGGKFVGWETGNDFYHHPFTVPLGYERIDAAPYLDDVRQFADLTNYQQAVCEAGLGPKAPTDAEYTAKLNYAYHLDAGAFADMLKKHCREKLGVNHIVNTVESVTQNIQGGIQSMLLTDGQVIDADLFIDCSGAPALLIGKALGVKKHSTKDILLNDSALAIQLPYANETSPIASMTIATAQTVGWVWDIGLQKRRGVGYVYASDYIEEQNAYDVLTQYAEKTHSKADIASLNIKKIGFDPGYRKQIWQHNCVAVGMAAGFVEPLEATAIMLVEQSAKYIAENLPVDEATMQVVSKRFNEKMQYRWQRIIDFLKLHYLLTKRPEAYWQAQANFATCPQSLKDDLLIWQSRGPQAADFDSSIELFPAASYQYVLYGMGFKPNYQQHAHLYKMAEQADAILTRNQSVKESLLNSLPTNREYFLN